MSINFHILREIIKQFSPFICFDINSDKQEIEVLHLLIGLETIQNFEIECSEIGEAMLNRKISSSRLLEFLWFRHIKEIQWLFYPVKQIIQKIKRNLYEER